MGIDQSLTTIFQEVKMLSKMKEYLISMKTKTTAIFSTQTVSFRILITILTTSMNFKQTALTIENNNWSIKQINSNF